MLDPSQGREGVVRFVVDTVERAGPSACPPLIVGVGVGGTFESAALLAKEAVIRHAGSRSPVLHLAQLEEELIERCNALGIGPMGFGGSVTVMDVFVEERPAHIASLPVAVNIQCHSARFRETTL
jgi:fumarate hydratase subunit alpha